MRVALLAVVAGCSFEHGRVGGDDARLDDDMQLADEGFDMSPECLQWQAKHFDACAIPSPSGDLVITAALSPYTYDTTTAGGTLVDIADRDALYEVMERR